MEQLEQDVITDDELVEALRKRINHRRRRVTALEAEVAEHRTQLRRDERALSLLSGEVAQPGPKRTRSQSPKPMKIGPELLASVEAAVRLYAQDHEEFRQVDIRKMPNTPSDKSSAIAVAFENLRQQNVVRFVRQDGNNKWYRLTDGAVAENGNGSA